MSQVLSSSGLEPGVFAQFESSTTAPLSIGGLRILALVGSGLTNANVLGESVTKGTTNSIDSLAVAAASLPSTIVDENFVSYSLGTDYQLTSGDVDWSLANPAIQLGSQVGTSFAVNGLTLEVYLAGSGTPESVTFSGTNPVSIASVVAQLGMSGLTASSVGGTQVQIQTTATDNTSLRIGAGTANGVLGFTEGIITYSSQEPLPGVKYSLSYTRAKTSADYVPATFFDLPSVVSAYGPVSTSNSISLAAMLAFQNGASAVMGMQLNPSDGATLTQFQKALDKLRSVDLNIIVPLSTDTNLYAYVKAHVDNMSSLQEQRFRTALVGLGGTPSISEIKALAAGLKDRRVALVYPPSATVLIPGDSAASTVDGSYIAAAIGGIRVNPAFDVAEPLLRKQVVGFASIQDTLLRTQKNVIANSGVMIVENQNGVARVRDGLTTDLTTADSSEYSVTEILDFVSITTRTFLDAAFIGTKFLNDTPKLMSASLEIILQSMVEGKILTGQSNIRVVRNQQDPRQIDVSFLVAPVFGVKYILISFTI